MISIKLIYNMELLPVPLDYISDHTIRMSTYATVKNVHNQCHCKSKLDSKQPPSSTHDLVRTLLHTVCYTQSIPPPHK